MKYNSFLLAIFALVFALGLACLPSLSQVPTSSGVIAIQSGGNLLHVVPNAPIVFCNYPPVLGTPACTNLATTYNSFTQATPCPPGQVTLPTTTTCSPTADASGNFSIYTQPGNYVYYFEVSSVWYGPYGLTLGGGPSAFSPPNPANFPGAANIPGPLTIGASVPPGISAILFNQQDPFGLCNASGYDQLTDVADLATSSSALAWNPDCLLNQRVFTTAFQSNPYAQGNLWTYDVATGLPIVAQGATIDPLTGIATVNLIASPGLGLSLGVDTGAANAYVACPSGSPTVTLSSANKGLTVNFAATTLNSGGASTLNWCGSGVKSITKNGGVALVAGDIPVAPYPVQLTWDGTEWSENNPVASSGSGTIAIGTSTHFGIYTAATTVGPSTQVTEVGGVFSVGTDSIVSTAPGAASVQTEIADPGAPGANKGSIYNSNAYLRWMLYNHNAGPKAAATWSCTTAGCIEYGGATQLNGLNTEALLAGNSSGIQLFSENASGVPAWLPLSNPAGTGVVTFTGSQTTNSLGKWNANNDLINSLFTDSGTNGSYTGTGGFFTLRYNTGTNCVTNTSCGSASAGMAAIAATTATIVVNTTSVTANSEIRLQFDESIGGASQLNVTCNSGTSEGATYWISARTPGSQFTIKTNVTPVTNPACISWSFVN